MFCLPHTQVSEDVVSHLPFDSSLAVVERQVIDAVKKASKTFNSRVPEVICIAHENDPRAAHIPTVAAAASLRKSSPQQQEGEEQKQRGTLRRRSVRPWEQRPQQASVGEAEGPSGMAEVTDLPEDKPLDGTSGEGEAAKEGLLQARKANQAARRRAWQGGDGPPAARNGGE